MGLTETLMLNTEAEGGRVGAEAGEGSAGRVPIHQHGYKSFSVTFSDKTALAGTDRDDLGVLEYFHLVLGAGRAVDL